MYVKAEQEIAQFLAVSTAKVFLQTLNTNANPRFHGSPYYHGKDICTYPTYVLYEFIFGCTDNMTLITNIESL